MNTNTHRKQPLHRLGGLAVVLAWIISASFVVVLAANVTIGGTTTLLTDAGITIGVTTAKTANSVWTVTGSSLGNAKLEGKMTAYQSGCDWIGGDGTLTITNNLGEADSKAVLSFQYSVSGQGSVKVGDTPYTGTGTFTQTLTKGSSVKFTAVSAAEDGAELKFTLSNFSLSAESSVNVTFSPAESGGSYTLNGTKVTSSKTENAQNTTTFTVSGVAAPTGKYFWGWEWTPKNGTAKWLSVKKTDTFTFAEDGTLSPVFKSSIATFAAGTTPYATLDEAVAAATSGTDSLSKQITQLADVTINKSYTIPAGVTLLIPYDDAHTVVTTTPPVVTSYSTSTAPTAYRTLTMANGAKIILNGSLSVGGVLAASQTNGYNGLPTGKLGYIKMNEGSSIVANSGSNMYIIGYIYGAGTVTVNSGASVYECFQIRDFRGGRATSSVKDATEGIAAWGGSKRVFPLSQYYVQNIEVPMTLNTGAIVKGVTAFNVSEAFQFPAIPFIGNTGDYMFQITNGSVEKDYIEETDRLNVKINGSLSVSPFSFDVAGWGDMTSIDTSKYILPINQNITVEVLGGNSFSISQDIALLPGAEILVHENATCTLSSGTEVILYDSENWGNYCGEKHHLTGDDAPLKPLIFVAEGVPKTNRFTTNAASLADPSVMINGTVDASAGSVYATAGGANVYSTANGVLKLGNAPGTLDTYQAVQDGGNISFTTIPAYAVKLRHEDSTTLDTAGTSAATYNYDHQFCCGDAKHGVWYAGNHAYDSAGVCACKKGHAVSKVVSNSDNASYYSTLVEAYDAFDRSNHSYVQMMASTSEPNFTVAKSFPLDLSGCTIANLAVGSGGTLNGMDTTTNDFGIGGTTPGSITTLTVDGGIVNEVYQYDLNGISGKKYIAYKQGDSVSFHRFDLGVSEYTFYGYTDIESGIPTGAMTFTAAFKGDASALAAMTDKGFQVEDSQAFASETHNGTTAALENISSDGKVIGHTLTGTLSGFNLDNGPSFTETFAVHALLKAAKIGQTGSAVYSNADFTDSSVHSDDGLSFAEACQIAYNRMKTSEEGSPDRTMADKIFQFAKSNGFDLTE